MITIKHRQMTAKSRHFFKGLDIIRAEKVVGFFGLSLIDDVKVKTLCRLIHHANQSRNFEESKMEPLIISADFCGYVFSGEILSVMHPQENMKNYAVFFSFERENIKNRFSWLPSVEKNRIAKIATNDLSDFDNLMMLLKIADGRILD